MDLFEYQGKQLFARYGIPVSAGEAVTTVEDAVADRKSTRLNSVTRSSRMPSSA